MTQRRLERRTFFLVTTLLVAAVALAVGFSGCTRSTPAWSNRGGPPRIVVTIPALDNFVRNVGGKHVGIICLCTTQGPHHYQYNTQDAMLLREADLFFAIGLRLDDKFAEPMQRESHNPHLRYVKLGEDKRMEKLLLHLEEQHEHGEFDPHVWLGIPQAIALVEIIRDELKKVDPNHEADYDKNATEYIAKLKDLHAYGKKQLQGKKNRKIIAFHESLGYFAKSFDVDIADVIEETPGAEMSASRMVKLAQKCLANDIRVIAVEPQYPKETSARKLAEAVKEKDKAKDMALIEIDPLETTASNDLKEDGKELKSPDWYDKKMRENLDKLAKALP